MKLLPFSSHQLDGKPLAAQRPSPLSALDNLGANGALLKVRAAHTPMHAPCRFSRPSLVRVCRLANGLDAILKRAAGDVGASLWSL